MTKPSEFSIAGVPVKPGQSRDVRLKISETYTGDEIAIPIRVKRARKPGPTVFISAAVHGDELNGTGIIHELVYSRPVSLKCGTLLLLPVVNVLGFENQERYMPDRRDLNRCFPGFEKGSLTSRIAYTILHEVIKKCDYGIDLHTAASYRTNFPNIRGDLSMPAVKQLADAFGCELVVDGKGPVGSLRREACRAGCPTIILEGGEPYKLEPSILETGVQGIHNTLINLGMATGTTSKPPYKAHIRKTTWVRAEVGGIIRFHVRLGDLVEAGQPIASNYSILGQQQSSLLCPTDGIVLGLTTMPAIKPGEPVCHIAIISKRMKSIRRAIERMDSEHLHQRVRADLATNISAVESTESEQA